MYAGVTFREVTAETWKFCAVTADTVFFKKLEKSEQRKKYDLQYGVCSYHNALVKVTKDKCTQT